MKIKAAGLLTALFALILSAGVSAQDDIVRAAAGDKYVISAKAGGINFVEGTVAVVRNSGRSGQLLKGDSLAVGDQVSTGANGRVEILLNPGSYLRLGENSTFQFRTTTLDDLNLVLGRGSAILEVFADDDFRVKLHTPQMRYDLIESGVYRIDAGTEGTGTISVWKGRAEIQDENKTVLKRGREATVSKGGVAVAKFDRDDKDSLETWSRSRAKELSRISENLKRKALKPALMNSFLGRRWDVFNSFGLWVYDPFGRNYCFLPFGWGWRSPYGFGFGDYLGRYGLPPAIYYTPSTPAPTGYGNTPAPVSRRPVTVFGGGDGAVPPFMRVQGSSGTMGARAVFPDGSSNPSYDSSSGRSISMPTSAPISSQPSVPTRSNAPSKQP